MSLAVLGADGFIGSAVVRSALERSLDVVPICVEEPWRLEEMGISPERGLRIPRECWSEPGGAPDLVAAIREAETLVLLAYTPPASGAQPLEHELAVNAEGAGRLAAIAGESGTRVVFSSSADVYGPWHVSPVEEGTPAAPVTPYAVAKVRAEEAVTSAAEATCVRISTVFGARENGPRAIPSFIRAAIRREPAVIHGDGSDVKDYVHVDDVAAAIIAAAVRGGAGVINVGSGVGRRTDEIHRLVAKAAGAEPTPPRYEAGDRPPSRLVLDTAKAARELDFEPLVEFESGLAEEAAWVRAALTAG